MKLKVMLDEGAYMPEKAYEADAGFDLRSPESDLIYGGESKIINTGVHVEIPKGYVGFLKSKSGLNIKHNLVGEGVIDSGYTGAIVCKLYNYGHLAYKVNKGDKIIQLVILPIPEVELELSEEFDTTKRGSNGFGSTGR